MRLTFEPVQQRLWLKPMFTHRSTSSRPVLVRTDIHHLREREYRDATLRGESLCQDGASPPPVRASASPTCLSLVSFIPARSHFFRRSLSAAVFFFLVPSHHRARYGQCIFTWPSFSGYSGRLETPLSTLGVVTRNSKRPTLLSI